MKRFVVELTRTETRRVTMEIEAEDERKAKTFALLHVWQSEAAHGQTVSRTPFRVKGILPLDL